MRISVHRLRTALLVMAVIVCVRDYRATLSAHYDLCGDVCSYSNCATECYENEMEFENGNSISCLDYGVYDSGQACCGDGSCNNGEDTGSCYSDCYVPDPPGPELAVLVNGTGYPTDYAPWTLPGSYEYATIYSTYNVEPIPYHWDTSDISIVDFTTNYVGIYSGAGPLASFINGLPAGDVNIVAHSHGGNVSILATQQINRQIRHLIELATPVNIDLERYVGGNGVYERCIASSWSDWVQFIGSSPIQVGAYFGALGLASHWGELAADAWAYQDYEAFWAYEALETFWLNYADWMFSSTKIEVDGTTVGFGGLDHSDMHEPDVWNNLPGYCKIG